MAIKVERHQEKLLLLMDFPFFGYTIKGSSGSILVLRQLQG